MGFLSFAFTSAGAVYGRLCPAVAQITTKYLPSTSSIDTPRRIYWLYQLVVLKHLSLNLVKVFLWYTFHRTNSYAILFGNTNDYISTAEIVNVIGKRTDAMIDGCWVPSFLELDPV